MEQFSPKHTPKFIWDVFFFNHFMPHQALTPLRHKELMDMKEFESIIEALEQQMRNQEDSR